MSNNDQSLKSAALALVVGCVLAFSLLEIGLRLYNPVLTSVRGSEIVLPINRQLIWTNPAENVKLESEIIHSRNQLGFRGPNPPTDWDAATTVLAIGGSTTECAFLTDGKDWPAVLHAILVEQDTRAWVNNAGFDGHSTIGHTRLLEQMVLELKPDYAIFLVGVNDTGVEVGKGFDESIEVEGQSLRNKIILLSETLTTVQAIYRSLRAKRLGLDHYWQLDLTTEKLISMTRAERAGAIAHLPTALPAFEQRVRKLVNLTRERGIEPVLVTQPALWGSVKDPSTGVDIGPIGHGGKTAALNWQILERFNDVTRQIGEEASILVVDLALNMPKDSKYYYDWMHFTNEGAALVAHLISAEFIPHAQAQKKLVMEKDPSHS